MSDAYTAGPLTAWTHNPAHARMQKWSREVLVEKCRAFHGRLPRAEAGDLQISPERLACATSTSATTNSSPPVMDMSVSNEEYGASTDFFACSPSLPVDPAFRPPVEAGSGQGDAFFAASGAAVVSSAASLRRSSLVPSSKECEGPIAAPV